MNRLVIGLAATALLSACGSSEPEIAANGPKLEAKLVRQFPLDGAPGRETAFSRDGTLWAASSASGNVYLRRMPGALPLRTIRHINGVASLAFSPDGRQLLTGGYDGTGRLWDVASGRQLRVRSGSSGTIWSVDASADGRQFATAGEDAAIRLWSPDGELLRTLRGHERNIWRIRFSPDSRTLASGSFDGSVKIWDTGTGALVRDLKGHEQAVVGLDYSPDGRLLASGSDDSTIRIWRAADGALLRTIPNGNHVYTVSFSPDGRWLATGGRARSAAGTFWHQLAGAGGETANVRIWRLSDGRPVAVLKHREDVMSVQFSPAGPWLATSSEGSEARLWQVRPGPLQ